MGSFNFPSSSGVNTVAPQGQGHEELQEVEHVRNVFPETWLWTNASVRYDLASQTAVIFCCLTWDQAIALP